MNRKTTIHALLCLAAMGMWACDSSSSSSSSGGSAKPTGSIEGLVSSTFGGSLDEYVTLTFTAQGTGKVVTRMADMAGFYSAGLRAGVYDVAAERPGYDGFRQLGVDVLKNKTTALDIDMVPIPAGEYIGSGDCGVCHESIYDTFSRSGHPFKINPIVNDEMPTYPFTSIAGALEMINDDDNDPNDPAGGTDNTLGTPLTYADVSYVIGGWGWKARFMDQDGFIVTGSEVQYNHFTSEMSSYHDNEVDKPFNCGNCHTTGWRHVDPINNPNRQDGRPGIDGTWAAPGVQCESCHGAGSLHAQTMLSATITRIAIPRTTEDFLDPDQAYGQPVSCGECHTRDGERDYPSYLSGFDNARLGAGESIEPMGGRILAKGGLVRHHEQFDEVLGIDPDDPQLASTRSPGFMAMHGDCNTCHDPHTTTVFQDVSGDLPGMNVDCTTCHADKVITQGGMQNLTCGDCHMPLMTKSATLTFDPSPGSERPPLGDITSHIFSIDLSKDPETEQFTPGGGFAYPWITGKWACKTCHSPGGSTFDIDFPSAFTIHD